MVWKDFKLGKVLGTGAFGEVLHAINTKNHTEYAVKREKTTCRSPQLFYEAKILRVLQSEDKTTDLGIPRVHYTGSEGDYNVMVMDLCGKSLESLFISNGKKFDLKTTLMIGYQML